MIVQSAAARVRSHPRAWTTAVLGRLVRPRPARRCMSNIPHIQHPPPECSELDIHTTILHSSLPPVCTLEPNTLELTQKKAYKLAP